MFPFVWPQGGLSKKDFSLLELQFSKTIFYFLPCETVSFIATEQYPGINPEEHVCDGIFETWKAGIGLARKERQPVVNAGGTLLFLPIWYEDDIVAVAVVDGGVSAKYGEYSAEWLQERSRLISRELRKIKECAYDTESGLLCGTYIKEEIETLIRMLACADSPHDDSSVEDSGEASGRGDSVWTLFLIEIFPKAKNSSQSSVDIAHSAATLSSLLGDRVSLCHFGSGLFGMLWNAEEEESQNLGYTLLRSLKRQRFHKVHIGMAPIHPHDISKVGGVLSENVDLVFDQAWQFLQSARDRGPFALCSAVGQAAANSFRRPVESVMTALQKSWRKTSKFSVALIHVERDGECKDDVFSKRVCSLVGEEGIIFPESSDDAYIYLPEMDQQQAANWLGDFQNKIAKLKGPKYSIGVASFPYHNFKKVDVAVNARKALIHTAFFGAGSMTAFDGVSLNISGDVYYNEGDLPNAVKEYKLGLKIDPDNINLMNSLAVIYAQINRYSLAIPLFEKVLSLDRDNFMALFNLGFAHLNRKNVINAVEYFEKAYKIDDSYFDLLLQLGQIYCDMGKHTKALKFLHQAEDSVSSARSVNERRPWSKGEELDIDKSIGHGLVYKYLGKAYLGAKKQKEAIVYFQRAIGYNDRDAESLSQLGSLYLLGKEGADIALSLCLQAVKLDDSRSDYWYCLANVQLAIDDFASAETSLKECLHLSKKDVNALLMLAQVYIKMGLKKKALTVYKKVLKIDNNNKKAKQALKA